MSTEPWELVENPSIYTDYNWFSDDVPARRFYLFIAEIGRRLQHVMTDSGPLKMIKFCEQCAEGEITEDELSDLSDEHRPKPTDNVACHRANNLYWMVADRYKVNTRCVQWAADAFPLLAVTNAGLLSPTASDEEIESVRNHPIFASVYQRTEVEWGELVRDIFGPNPFRPVAFDPAWRTSTTVALAQQMYDARDFGLMPILGDALQDAGCENEDILAHCRDANGTHVRGCWVVDLVLGKSA
jgi:hypothetical protein